MTAIEYTYLDDNRTERTGIYTGDRDAAIERAVEYLSAANDWLAARSGGAVLTDDDLAELGSALLEHPDGDVYSLWCAR